LLVSPDQKGMSSLLEEGIIAKKTWGYDMGESDGAI
jgi:hypothetical protein